MAHTLPIAPDWEFTRIRTGDTQTFAFHSSPSCPGYSFDVSHWRLRKENRERLCGDLDLGPHNYQQVERALGTSAFVGTSRALQEIQEKSIELVATSRIPDGPIEVTTALTPVIQQRILAVAAMQDFQSPPVSLLVVPLCALEIRDRTPYVIDRVPWPFSTPPKALIHLASSGFKSGLNCGILAVAPNSDDLWIVSKFSQCEVGVTSDLTCNRTTAFDFLDGAEKLAGMADKVEQIPLILDAVRTMLPHVLAVPALQAELVDAQFAPTEYALEIERRLAEILTPEERVIWQAVRNAGTQKGALPELRKSGIVNSTGTLNRRVRKLDVKLKNAGLPPTQASGPISRFKKSRNCAHGEDKTSTEELSETTQEWDRDPHEREAAIRQYIMANPMDREHLEQTKAGIKDEAEQYQKQHRVKLD